MDDLRNATILTYHSDTVPADAEVFALWHGAEHRVNDLIVEWGDVENWNIEHSEGYVKAINPSLGAEIILRLREVDLSGTKS